MPLKSFSQPELRADLLSRATSLLNAEVTRLQPLRALSQAPLSQGALSQGSGLKPGEPWVTPLGSGGAERTASVLPLSNATGLAPELPPGVSAASAPMDLLTSVLAGANVDELRRRASDFLETLLASVSQGKAASGNADDDRVPLLRSVAPVQPGAKGSVTLRVTNEEASVSEVSLYASNFVADSGYEMPSLLVSVAPRKATLPPGGEAMFEIQLAVPAQAPPGLYSGLVQAVGCKYVKAVVMFEVL